MPRHTPIVAIFGLLGASALGETIHDVGSSLSLDIADIRWSDAAPPKDDSLGKPSPLPYGQPGQWWLSVGAGLGFGQTDGDFALDGRLNLTTSTFVVETPSS